MASPVIRAMTGPRFSLPAQLPARAGWLALVLGVVSATGFQPMGLWPLALLAVGGCAWLLRLSKGVRQALWLGWLFGLGHFTLGNAWIATAFTYQAQMPPLLGWAAVPLLAVYLAVYPALAAGAARWLAGSKPGPAFVLAFAGCWIVAEWLRSWAFSGYAWNPLGAVLLGPFDRPGLAALAPFMGSYALSGLAAALGAGVVALLGARRWVPALLVSALVVAGMLAPAPAQREGTLAVTVVQPGIEQPRINDPLFYRANFNRLAALSAPRRNQRGAPRLVVWPESGMADYLDDGYPQRFYDGTTALGSPLYARRQIARVIGPNSTLLTGALRLELDEAGGLTGVRNAVLALRGADATIVGTYAKAHLVPYGEYLPMREWLEPLGLARLVPGSVDFIPGPGPATVDLGPAGRAGLQVCYEIIFSGQVVDRANRPQFLVNGSNDGWFGTFGSPQHFAQARLRAVEEGLPVLRATTTGISGVIDAHGVVRQHLPMHRQGRIDARIPPALAPTPCALLGNILPLCWALVFLLAALVARRRKRH